MVALIIGIGGTLLSSYKTIENVLICCGIGAIIVLVMILVPLSLKIAEKIKEIERA